jgi:hypothetical protein
MVIAADLDGKPIAFAPVAVKAGSGVDRFAFVVYRCPICSYVECLDCALPMGMSTNVVITSRAGDEAGDANDVEAST